MIRLPSVSRSRWLIIGGLTFAVVLLTHFVSSSAADTLLDWQSLSNQVSSSLSSSLSLSAGRGTDWLVSNGQALYSVRNSEVTNLTDRIQSSGRVSAIGTDQARYLLAFNNANQTQPILRLTDGNTWEDVPNSSFYLHPQINRITGSYGNWLIQSSDTASTYSPGSWELIRWSKDQIANNLPLPEQISHFNAGCFTYPENSKVCAGVSTPVYVNGDLFLFGGTSESRDTNDRITQAATASAWRWDGQRFANLTTFPQTKFVSAVWEGQGQALIATSHAVTNPFAADDLWLFDGRTFTSLREQALRAGLLSIDARTIKAAQSNGSWLIVANKKVIRLENQTLSVAGTTRDRYETVAGGQSGLFLVGGAQSAFDRADAFSPIQAALATVATNSNATHDAAQLFRSASSEELDHLATINVATAPYVTELKNGGWFTYEASASDPEGVKQVDLLVQGAIVKTCSSDTCSYTQQYWSNGQDRRSIPFVTRVTDQNNHVTESQTFTLTITPESTNSTVPPVYIPPYTPPAQNLPPNGLGWKTNNNQLTYSAWTEVDGGGVWRQDNTLRFRVMGRENTRGVEAIVLWVNGQAVRTCVMTAAEKTVNQLVSCDVSLSGANYPANAEVFMNAQFIKTWNKQAKTRPSPLDLWTEGLRVTPQAIPSSYYPSTGAYDPWGYLIPVTNGPLTADAWLTPNVTELTDNQTITYTVSAWGPLPLKEIRLSLNGQFLNTCTFSSYTSGHECSASVQANQYTHGQILTFTAQAEDTAGHIAWIPSKVVTVRHGWSALPNTRNGYRIWKKR